MKAYIFNLETTKIELHFDKSEYIAMTDEQKKDIKSNFLWSNQGKCWVSRCKEPNLYWARQAAEKLGFTDEQREGERLTMSEQLERKSEKAENRADRYQTYAANADQRAQGLQADFNKYRQDWSWLTQPIISGHSGSQRFASHKEKVMKRYERGFDEYRKSDYFRDKAATAQSTADMTELKNKPYLDRRIKEAQKHLKGLQEQIVKASDQLYRAEQGEELKNYKGEILTPERIQRALAYLMEQWEVYEDKEAFYQNCLDDLGGVNYNRDNIEIGFIVKLERWGLCEVVGKGSVNISYKILTGEAAGMGGKATYAEIKEIVKTEIQEKESHAFSIGERYSVKKWSEGKRNFIPCVYQIIKTTEKSITLQLVELDGTVVENGEKLNRKPRETYRGDGWAVSINNNLDGTIYKYKVKEQSA